MRDIRGVDLIAKEFQVHDKCRKDYIRKEPVIDNSAGLSQNAGKFEEVKREIEENVVGNNRAISMKAIHEMYDDGHAGDTRYRNKLKQRIMNEFPGALYFLQTVKVQK